MLFNYVKVLAANRKPCTFQSTQPSQAVTLHSSKRNMRKMISIHTALAGCDHDKVILYNLTVISIHTALAGCDMKDAESNDYIIIFQSTQPSQAVTF